MHQPATFVEHQHIAHDRLPCGAAHQRTDLVQVAVVQRVGQRVGQLARHRFAAAAHAAVEQFMDDATTEVAHLALHRRLPPQQHRQDRHHHDHRPAHREQEPGLHSRAEPLHSTSIRTRVNPCFNSSSRCCACASTRWKPEVPKTDAAPLCLRVAGRLQQDVLQPVTYPRVKVGANHFHRPWVGFGAQQFAEVAPECRRHPSLVIPVHAAHRPHFDHALVHERGDVQLATCEHVPHAVPARHVPHTGQDLRRQPSCSSVITGTR